MFELYRNYEREIHGRENRSTSFCHRHICRSPAYDPDDPADDHLKNREAPEDFTEVDEGRDFVEEPIYPGRGAFHCYHRIDGKLVAVGVLDITEKMVNSKYFLYDTSYAQLYLGVVGAIHEIEYTKMLQKQYAPKIELYQLGDLVLGCPKVNYKLNYKPGLVSCLRTKKRLRYEDVKEKMEKYSKMPQA